MDAYFLGTFLRGGVGFAVYNDDFFAPEFRGLRTVYQSYTDMALNIVNGIESLNSKADMENYNAKVMPIITNIWGAQKTKAALASYYRGEFTYP